jgi:hypothetical protein
LYGCKYRGTILDTDGIMTGYLYRITWKTKRFGKKEIGMASCFQNGI